MAAPNEITPKQLLRLIGTPDCPLIIDICLDEDRTTDPHIIPGSIRQRHTNVDQILTLATERSVVVVCQKGLKLSMGLASLLRSKGIAAEYLAGGIFAWRDTIDAPRLALSTLPNKKLWVTRHRPKIGRIATPWLIHRFIDPGAEFLFVAPDQVANVADRYNAIPFDIPDVPFSHRGDHCTFDALLDHFNLRTTALDALSLVVRAADTGSNVCSQAAGLLAVSVGLSRMYKDDHEQLTAAIPLYDALYRWARDGQSETHSSFGDSA